MQSMQEISDTLVPAGYELHYSIAGHNLTQMVHTRRFDLVLHNMMVEGISGFDVLKKIKGSGLNSEVPVVFITDSERKKDMMQGLHVSGIDFLKAPYNREELLTRINNQITMLKTSEKLEQSRSVTKSIRYAERIQKAMAPPESRFEEFFADHFLINLPRDIVSGDFYWARKIDHLKLIAVADCTGHGVPGAFLSVLGISLLNEICTKAKLENANLILEKLRRKLKNTLLRADGHSPISDGMDISLILIDSERMTMQFAGAYNRVQIARNGEITELRGDLQPIGFHPVEKVFTNHRFNLEKGDKIYMTTDGYVDQFGGDNGKKLQYRNYRKLIQEISQYDMQKQKAILLREHMQWKGINDQVDDILMMGIQI
jgi:serine phosphatase RsbU (regulator of sigma subunit)